MANNLSPEILQWLRSQGIPTTRAGLTDSTGATWHPTYTGAQPATDASDPSDGILTAYMRDVNPGHNEAGDYQDMFDTSGNWTGRAVVPKDSSMQEFLTGLAMMAGPFAAAIGGAGAAAGGAGGGLAGGGGASLGDLDLMYAGGMDGGATLGGGAMNYGAGLTGGTPWEAGFTGTGAISGPEDIDLMYGGGMDGGATLGGGAMNYAPELGGSSSTAAMGASPASTVGGGSLSSMGGLLGPAASLVGGLLGSKGQQSGQTTQNQIDPRMAPYLYGDGGVMPLAQQQMQRSVSPERLAMNDQFRQAGLGLLGQGVAPNGFSRFFPGR